MEQGPITYTPLVSGQLVSITFNKELLSDVGFAPGGSKLVVGRNAKMIDGNQADFEMTNNGECLILQCASAAGGWLILSHYVPV